MQIESIFGPGNGALKKQLLMTGLGTGPDQPEVTAMISNMVDSQVAILNKAGKLGKAA